MGIWLVALLFVAANHYLGWGVFGQADKKALVIVFMVGGLSWMVFGPRLEEDMRVEVAARREQEEAAECARDKSNDAGESERLRHSIGMPPDEK